MTTRDRIVLVVVAIAAAIVGTWLLVIGPKRTEASKLGDQLKVAQTQLQTAQQQVQAGLAAKSQFAASYTQMARLGEAVPADDNVPSMIVQLQNAAASDRVDFLSLSVSASSGASTGTSTGTSTTVPASTAQAVTASLPPGAIVGPGGFPVQPFIFTFRGNFFHLSDFLGRVQRFVVVKHNNVTVSGRLLSFDAISLGAGPSGFPQITATIAATAYLVPASQGVMAGATSTGPSSSPQSVSTSGSSSATTAPAAVATSPIR